MFVDEKRLGEGGVEIAPWRQKLLDMAAYIEENGWTQGQLSAGRAVCVIGSARAVEGFVDTHLISSEGWAALAQLLHYVACENLAGWNDTSGRTQAEVLAALRGAARAQP